MKRLLPDSIAGRVIVVLLVGLTLSHLASMWAHRAWVVSELGQSGEQLADRIVSVKRAIQETPVPNRDRTAHALSLHSLQVHWSQTSLLDDPSRLDGQAEELFQRLQQLAPDFERQQFRAAVFSERAAAEFGQSADQYQLLTSLQLPDGTWVNFGIPHAVGQGFGFIDFLISTSLMAVAVLVLSGIAVRIFTAPLRSFAKAAERLGVDVTAPPMEETGPKEVRQSARTFNEMQRRIKKMITDRTQMLAAISHDLRTPITRLRLRAEFIDDEEQHRKMLADLEEMEAMIGSTLAFLRDDANKEEAKMIDLSALLGTICDDMADTGRRVRFTGPSHAILHCRPLVLKRAFTNLIDNAVTYGGGAEIRLSEMGSYLEVEVRDNGPGIPDREKERVFDPFYRIEGSRSRATGGTGLGLTVARSIIRGHGGDVLLQNAPEGGLKVIVRLPQLNLESETLSARSDPANVRA